MRRGTTPVTTPVRNTAPTTGTGWRRRAGVAVLAAALALAPVPALAATNSAADVDRVAPARLAEFGDGGSGWGRGWGDGGATTAATVDSDPATDAESTGVVLIETRLGDSGQGAGTGIVLTAGGEVLTNYHVVEGSTAIRVTVAQTGQTYDATVVGHGTSTDVALLQLSGASGLTPASVDDDTLGLGDDVTAVGNAGGTGTLTAADGTVTDLDSSITTASEGTVAGARLTDLIRTSADVVPGDSGGPLLDAKGEVVGVDTAASSGPEIDGYAIPIDTALDVVAAIRAGTDGDGVQVGPTAFLGVQLAAGAYPGATQASGAVIAGTVAGSAAEQLGLAAGDVVTAVDGTPVASAEALSAALADHQPGDRVELSWTGADGSHSATATLGTNPTA